MAGQYDNVCLQGDIEKTNNKGGKIAALDILVRMEASTRFELVNTGFANQPLKPLGYDANEPEIYCNPEFRQAPCPN